MKATSTEEERRIVSLYRQAEEEESVQPDHLGQKQHTVPGSRRDDEE